MWVGMESTRPHEKGCPSPPQIDISHRKCHSLCKRQIILGNLPEPTLGIDIGQNEYNHFLGYILINPSRDVHVSVAVAFW